jgi:glutathione S-transferase
MKLFAAPASPFARKAVVVVLEAGLSDKVDIVPAAGNAVDPGTMPVDVNPLGKIPALQCDDGRTVYDSVVICRYLAEMAMPQLYPTGPALWDSLTLEATADGIMDASVLMVYETRLRPEELRFAPWVEGQWAKIVRALDMVEQRWMPHLSGPLEIGQIALACALGHLDLRHCARQWREGRPKLASWAASFAERPSMMATHPKA